MQTADALTVLDLLGKARLFRYSACSYIRLPLRLLQNEVLNLKG